MRVVHHIEYDADGVAHSTLCVVEDKKPSVLNTHGLIEQVEDNEAGRTHLFNKYSANDMENARLCGNPQCSCSTGIHGGLTFGHGGLDFAGYWEFPCRVCAAAFDAERTERLQEFENEVGKEKAYGDVDLSWARQDGWPFITTDVEKITTEFQEQRKEQEALDQEWGNLFPECHG